MTDDFTALRAQAALTIAKADLFDALMKALVHGTGEYKKIKARGRKRYEAEARERIETRRRAHADQI